MTSPGPAQTSPSSHQTRDVGAEAGDPRDPRDRLEDSLWEEDDKNRSLCLLIFPPAQCP